jgi:hypothetical protein
MGSFVLPPPLLLQGRAGNLARAASALDDARAAPQDAALRMRSAEMAFLQAEDAVFQTSRVHDACARGAMDVGAADVLVAISEPVMAAMGMVGALIVCAPPPGVAQAMVAALDAAAVVLRGVAAAWDGADVDVADAARPARRQRTERRILSPPSATGRRGRRQAGVRAIDGALPHVHRW